jgi:hypothetical protein
VRSAGPLLLFAAGCASPPENPNYRIRGPVYDAAAVSRLEFEGVHLGMEQSEACEALIARGYTRQGRSDCGPHDDLRDDDGFLGRGAGDSRPYAGPGDAPEVIQHVHLRYQAVAGRQMVIKVGGYSRAPHQPERLTRAAFAAWGPPTFYGHYAVDYVAMNWAGSARQANPDNRNRFGHCTYRPQCEWQRGIDCAPIFREFATPVAHVVIYDWGRDVTIEDHGAVLRALRSSGDLRRRPWESPRHACPPPPPIH